MGVASALSSLQRFGAVTCTPWPVKADEHLPQRDQSTAVGPGLLEGPTDGTRGASQVGTEEAAPIACSAGYGIGIDSIG